MVARRLVLALLVILAASFLFAQKKPPLDQGAEVSRGRSAIHPPDRTDRGTWDGTWVYVYRDGKMGLWIKTVDGEPQLKIEFRSKQGNEVFETDWDSKASYEMEDAPATFAFTATRKDANVIEGTWFWDWQAEKQGRTEKANLTIYRAGNGRQLVFLFNDYEKTIREGDRKGRHAGPLAWTFTKASKRLVLWDELPY